MRRVSCRLLIFLLLAFQGCGPDAIAETRASTTAQSLTEAELLYPQMRQRLLAEHMQRSGLLKDAAAFDALWHAALPSVHLAFEAEGTSGNIQRCYVSNGSGNPADWTSYVLGRASATPWWCRGLTERLGVDGGRWETRTAGYVSTIDHLVEWRNEISAGIAGRFQYHITFPIRGDRMWVRRLVALVAQVSEFLWLTGGVDTSPVRPSNLHRPWALDDLQAVQALLMDAADCAATEGCDLAAFWASKDTPDVRISHRYKHFDIGIRVNMYQKTDRASAKLNERVRYTPLSVDDPVDPRRMGLELRILPNQLELSSWLIALLVHALENGLEGPVKLGPLVTDARGSVLAASPYTLEQALVPMKDESNGFVERISMAGWDRLEATESAVGDLRAWLDAAWVSPFETAANERITEAQWRTRFAFPWLSLSHRRWITSTARSEWNVSRRVLEEEILNTSVGEPHETVAGWYRDWQERPYTFESCGDVVLPAALW